MNDIAELNPLYESIREALLLSMARNLRNAPHPDDFPATVAVMAQDLTAAGYGVDHLQRIHEAIHYLGRIQDFWPTVRQVLQRMQETAPKPKQLEPPPDDPEQRARISAMARELAGKVRGERGQRYERQPVTPERRVVSTNDPLHTDPLTPEQRAEMQRLMVASGPGAANAYFERCMQEFFAPGTASTATTAGASR